MFGLVVELPSFHFASGMVSDKLTRLTHNTGSLYADRPPKSIKLFENEL